MYDTIEPIIEFVEDTIEPIKTAIDDAVSAILPDDLEALLNELGDTPSAPLATSQRWTSGSRRHGEQPSSGDPTTFASTRKQKPVAQRRCARVGGSAYVSIGLDLA